ncbi:hypothetical protein Tco_0060256 [Tanacetum coccineum]
MKRWVEALQRTVAEQEDERGVVVQKQSKASSSKVIGKKKVIDYAQVFASMMQIRESHKVIYLLSLSAIRGFNSLYTMDVEALHLLVLMTRSIFWTLPKKSWSDEFEALTMKGNSNDANGRLHFVSVNVIAIPPRKQRLLWLADKEFSRCGTYIHIDPDRCPISMQSTEIFQVQSTRKPKLRLVEVIQLECAANFLGSTRNTMISAKKQYIVAIPTTEKQNMYYLEFERMLQSQLGHETDKATVHDANVRRQIRDHKLLLVARFTEGNLNLKQLYQIVRVFEELAYKPVNTASTEVNTGSTPSVPVQYCERSKGLLKRKEDQLRGRTDLQAEIPSIKEKQESQEQLKS